jgi:hypothetical protein
VSTIAAEAARLSGTSSVRPSGDTARYPAYPDGLLAGSGKSCGGAAPFGGGTASWSISFARPVLGDQEKTWTTSPPPPGSAGCAVPLLEESFRPET